MFKIGDFSRVSRVSIKTLRFYDEIGLLKPTYVDRFTGYRYYAPHLLTRINRILLFKELGFSLDEIAVLLKEDLLVGEVRDALQNKREELARRIAEEQERLVQVDSWLTQIEKAEAALNYEIRLKQIKPQWVASMRGLLNSYDDATELFAELNHYLKKRQVTGQQAAIWHVCQGQAQPIDCEALILLNDYVPASNRIKVYQLPATVNASLIHHGSDETIPEAYGAVRKWITHQGYRIDGANREIYWHGNVTQNANFGITEIQYPILKSPPGTSAHY
ncbi:MAG: MerR family transcriptional regulator [Acidobacteriota bacterium]